MDLKIGDKLDSPHPKGSPLRMVAHVRGFVDGRAVIRWWCRRRGWRYEVTSDVELRARLWTKRTRKTKETPCSPPLRP